MLATLLVASTYIQKYKKTGLLVISIKNIKLQRS